MLANYETYLHFLNKKLNKFFTEQKPYLFCHKGCAMCCKNAEFPYSLTELKYLLTGFLRLDKTTQDIIEKNLQNIADKKADFEGEKFLYDCPFLINDECSVYEYRGVVCRTFGLITCYPDEKIRVPFCCYKGLNYSNVIDLKTGKLSPKKFKERGFKEEPKGFNVNYKFLTDADFERGFNFLFGDKKPLIEWFINEQTASDKEEIKQLQIL